MKKVIGMAIGAVLGLSWTVFWLSCAEFTSFETQFNNAEYAFRWMVMDIIHTGVSDEDQAFCDQQWGQAVPWVYTYNFNVSKNYAGSVADQVILQREVDLVNCTRWGGCAEMELWQEYVIVTQDGNTLSWGLCSSCPYMLASEFFEEEPKAPECICTAEYDPVCGTNWESYGNTCSAWCNNVSIAYKGLCNDWCEHGNSPVCWTNGISYDTQCHLEEAETTKAYDGLCVNTHQQDLPRFAGFCDSWYKWCNTCTIEWCTEIACIDYSKVFCVEFNFTHLTVKEGEFIQTFVSSRLTKASEEKINKVTKRVQENRDAVLSTLATSSFPVGSKKLKTLEYTLEIIWLLETLLINR